MGASKKKKWRCVLTYAFGPLVEIVCEAFVTCTQVAVWCGVAGSISTDCLVGRTYVCEGHKSVGDTYVCQSTTVPPGESHYKSGEKQKTRSKTKDPKV